MPAVESERRADLVSNVESGKTDLNTIVDGGL